MLILFAENAYLVVRNLQIIEHMIGKKPAEYQMSIFEVVLESFIDMNHEVVLLSKYIDWTEVESEFAEYYCVDNVCQSIPIRTMVGMMLLKSIYNLSDESVVARWLENLNMQYFTARRCSRSARR